MNCQCGMCVEHPADYHPYAACLMFMSCHDGNTVEANLSAVVEHGRQEGRKAAEQTITALDAEKAELLMQRNPALSEQKTVIDELIKQEQP